MSYVIHDYECQNCKRLYLDRLACDKPETCEDCGSSEVEISYKGWIGRVRAGFLNNGRPVNERVHPDTGMMQCFGAADDPLTAIELGLRDGVGDDSMRTFTPDQQAEFAGRLFKDGDSKQLRESILTQRSRNQCAARETVRRATQ